MHTSLQLAVDEDEIPPTSITVIQMKRQIEEDSKKHRHVPANGSDTSGGESSDDDDDNNNNQSQPHSPSNHHLLLMHNTLSRSPRASTRHKRRVNVAAALASGSHIPRHTMMNNLYGRLHLNSSESITLQRDDETQSAIEHQTKEENLSSEQWRRVQVKQRSQLSGRFEASASSHHESKEEFILFQPVPPASSSSSSLPSYYPSGPPPVTNRRSAAEVMRASSAFSVLRPASAALRSNIKSDTSTLSGRISPRSALAALALSEHEERLADVAAREARLETNLAREHAARVKNQAAQAELIARMTEEMEGQGDEIDPITDEMIHSITDNADEGGTSSKGSKPHHRIIHSDRALSVAEIGRRNRARAELREIQQRDRTLQRLKYGDAASGVDTSEVLRSVGGWLEGRGMEGIIEDGILLRRNETQINETENIRKDAENAMRGVVDQLTIPHSLRLELLAKLASTTSAAFIDREKLIEVLKKNLWKARYYLKDAVHGFCAEECALHARIREHELEIKRLTSLDTENTTLRLQRALHMEEFNSAKEAAKAAQKELAELKFATSNTREHIAQLLSNEKILIESRENALNEARDLRHRLDAQIDRGNLLFDQINNLNKIHLNHKKQMILRESQLDAVNEMFRSRREIIKKLKEQKKMEEIEKQKKELEKKEKNAKESAELALKAAANAINAKKENDSTSTESSSNTFLTETKLDDHSSSSAISTDPSLPKPTSSSSSSDEQPLMGIGGGIPSSADPSSLLFHHIQVNKKLYRILQLNSENSKNRPDMMYELKEWIIAAEKQLRHIVEEEEKRVGLDLDDDNDDENNKSINRIHRRAMSVSDRAALKIEQMKLLEQQREKFRFLQESLIPEGSADDFIEDNDTAASPTTSPSSSSRAHRLLLEKEENEQLLQLLQEDQGDTSAEEERIEKKERRKELQMEYTTSPNNVGKPQLTDAQLDRLLIEEEMYESSNFTYTDEQRQLRLRRALERANMSPKEAKLDRRAERAEEREKKCIRRKEQKLLKDIQESQKEEEEERKTRDKENETETATQSATGIELSPSGTNSIAQSMDHPLNAATPTVRATRKLKGKGGKSHRSSDSPTAINSSRTRTNSARRSKSPHDQRSNSNKNSGAHRRSSVTQQQHTDDQSPSRKQQSQRISSATSRTASHPSIDPTPTHLKSKVKSKSHRSLGVDQQQIQSLENFVNKLTSSKKPHTVIPNAVVSHIAGGSTAALIAATLAAGKDTIAAATAAMNDGSIAVTATESEEEEQGEEEEDEQQTDDGSIETEEEEVGQEEDASSAAVVSTSSKVKGGKKRAGKKSKRAAARGRKNSSIEGNESIDRSSKHTSPLQPVTSQLPSAYRSASAASAPISFWPGQEFFSAPLDAAMAERQRIELDALIERRAKELLAQWQAQSKMESLNNRKSQTTQCPDMLVGAEELHVLESFFEMPSIEAPITTDIASDSQQAESAQSVPEPISPRSTTRTGPVAVPLSVSSRTIGVQVGIPPAFAHVQQYRSYLDALLTGIRSTSGNVARGSRGPVIVDPPSSLYAYLGPDKIESMESATLTAINTLIPFDCTNALRSAVVTTKTGKVGGEDRKSRSHDFASGDIDSVHGRKTHRATKSTFVTSMGGDDSVPPFHPLGMTGEEKLIIARKQTNVANQSVPNAAAKQSSSRLDEDVQNDADLNAFLLHMDALPEPNEEDEDDSSVHYEGAGRLFGEEDEEDVELSSVDKDASLDGGASVKHAKVSRRKLQSNRHQGDLDMIVQLVASIDAARRTKEATLAHKVQTLRFLDGQSAHAPPPLETVLHKLGLGNADSTASSSINRSEDTLEDTLASLSTDTRGRSIRSLAGHPAVAARAEALALQRRMAHSTILPAAQPLGNILDTSATAILAYQQHIAVTEPSTTNATAAGVVNSARSASSSDSTRGVRALDLIPRKSALSHFAFQPIPFNKTVYPMRTPTHIGIPEDIQATYDALNENQGLIPPREAGLDQQNAEDIDISHRARSSSLNTSLDGRWMDSVRSRLWSAQESLLRRRKLLLRGMVGSARQQLIHQLGGQIIGDEELINQAVAAENHAKSISQKKRITGNRGPLSNTLAPQSMDKEQAAAETASARAYQKLEMYARMRQLATPATMSTLPAVADASAGASFASPPLTLRTDVSTVGPLQQQQQVSRPKGDTSRPKSARGTSSGTATVATMPTFSSSPLMPHPPTISITIAAQTLTGPARTAGSRTLKFAAQSV
jgi:hypothetical protein